MSSELQFHVFIDAENISYNLVEPLFNEIIKYGTISGKRAYADWSNPAYKNWPSVLDKYGIRPYQKFHYDEDETDKAIIMDILETVYSNNSIKGICIIANDHIYGSVARRIREKGLYILGIGTRQASRKLVDACNNFVYIDNINTKPVTIQIEPTKEDELETLLIKAFNEINEERVHLGILGSILKKLNPAFDPRTYGHTNLSSLIKSFNDVFEVTSDKHIPPVYFVRYIKSNVDKEITGEVTRWFPYLKYGFIKTNVGDYYFNRTNIENFNETTIIKAGMPVVVYEFQAPNPQGDTAEEKNGKASKVEFIT